MANITTALLDFLMGLLQSPQAGEEFAADPDAALHHAGLDDICEADVDAVLPVALDFSPVGNREYDTGGNSIDNTVWSGGGHGGGGHGGGGHGGGGGSWGGGGDGHHDGGGHHGGGHHDGSDFAAAKAKLLSVVNNFSYIDDRDVINDQSTNTAIWAEDSIVGVHNEGENTATNVGDASMVATTGGTIIAGNTEYDLEVDIEDSFNEENDVEIEDSFNDNSDNSTDNSTNVVVEDSFNEDNSTEVDIEDSFNETDTEVDVDIEDSFNEDNSVDNSTNTDVELDVDVEDSFNEDNSVDNSTNTEVEVEVEDSFNEDNSTNTDIEVEDSFQANDNTVVEDNVVVNDSFQTETDVDVEVEDSFQANDNFSDNAVETGPGDQAADNDIAP
ncbi:IniB N-terminal domain-containing protein [Agromyces badenianii]|uniref:IniB N-terminal domain-containing protein n=1 Tax=Agromyces badenianii TaxID=2080742 RepID=UPI000D58F392|nr:IniB N-terminal domain-containing protein [Agromyces badenianii]PWC03306.1 hypothetical protein DCE94_13770 [Agromyces badenianii]